MTKIFSYRTAAIWLLTIFFSLPAWGYTLNGRIASNGLPLAQVEVKVTNETGDSLGQCSTDRNGMFLIGDIEVEKIVVETSAEGYSPLRLDVVTGNTDTDLGILTLEKNLDLAEVSVSAKSRVDVAGKTIVYPSKTDKERAANPLNMLTILSYKAPQIRVRESERTLTIDGETPQILVNGIKRPMSYISSINPDAIEKIEFSTTADVRYGKRYLNIIVRRPPEGGWVMGDVTAAVTTPRYFYSAVADYAKGKNDFMFYYTGGFRDGDKEYYNEQERYIGGGKDITLGVEGKPSSTIDRTNNLNFYFTRVQSENSMFAATAGLGFKNQDSRIYGDVTELTKHYERTNKRGYNVVRPSLNLYYTLTISKKTSFEVDAFGVYGDASTYRNLSYSSGYDSRVSTKSQNWYFSTELLWRQLLPFGRLNTGIAVSYNDASNKYLIDGVESRQPLSSTLLRGYTSLTGKLLTVGYNVSAGVSYYKVDGGMTSPVVTASLQRDFGDHFNLSYSFQYDPSMPSFSSYNETVTPVNDLMYHVGGNDLKRSVNIGNRLQGSFQKDKLYISLQTGLTNISNPFVTDYIYQSDPAKPYYQYFLEMPGNGHRFTSYGFDSNIGVSNLWNFLSFKISTGWSHRRVELSDSYTVAGWYLDLGMGLYWKGWQLNLTAENLVPTWTMWGGNVRRRTWPYTSLGLYKKFGRWYLRASWSNMFSRYGGRYRTETLSSVSPRYSEFLMEDQGNLVEIGVRYQFVTGKLLNKKNRSISADKNAESGVRWEY